MVKISAARIDLENGRVDNAMLKYYAETLVGGASGTNTGSTYTIDLSSGNVFHLILNADCTFTFSNPATTGKASGFYLLLKQDGSGAHAVRWPLAVAWPGDIFPILNTTASKWSAFYFFTVNGGNTWYGSVVEGLYS